MTAESLLILNSLFEGEIRGFYGTISSSFKGFPNPVYLYE